MKRVCLPLLAWACAWLGTSLARADDARFSQSLSAPEKTAAGLAKLDSDHIAVLDALIRRDTTRVATAEAATPTDSDKPAPTFAQRLSDDERRNAGLAALTPAEATQLEAYIARFQAGRLARTLLVPLSASARPSVTRLHERETKPERKIHGSYMLSFGWGSGGYQERTGGMSLHYDDPEGRYSVGVSYVETHVKGPAVYRDPLYVAPELQP